ncbi:DUF5316 domain-containing protein [Paenibacillus sepulcri]|uniref:DUF5316 domain-containing protein n=1 Tax=Paenibacillus sepulcri TaxID=359917 RepID=A0ABS7CC06_9BACL|nr:DUF5316 domain-containing protein [Paenibacillus sepulcri]
MSIFIYIGIISLFLAGILVGAWTDGNRQRGNYYSQNPDPKERRLKAKLSTWFFLISLVSFAIAAIYYFWIKGS